jgi:hypothetical protein
MSGVIYLNPKLELERLMFKTTVDNNFLNFLINLHNNIVEIYKA